MNLFLIAASITASTLAFGCSRPSAETPPVGAQVSDASAPSAAAVDAASEAPARALGLKLGFAYTSNLMGELEPCG